MNNPLMTDKDWEELEHGPFIYSDDKNYIKYNNDYNDINYYNDNNYSNDNDNNYSNNIEYFYECSRCNALWDESKEPKCICLDESELISFNDHEIENIPINLDTNKTDTKYLDKLKKNIPINLDKLKEKLIDKN